MTRFDAIAVPTAIPVADLPVSTFTAGGVEVASAVVGRSARERDEKEEESA